MSSIDLRQLRQRGVLLSRNRNFELYEHPAARRILRLHHWLNQLQLDLQRCTERGSVRLRPVIGSNRERRHILELEMPTLRFRRTVYLDADELLLLRQDRRMATILGESD
jgi:hypothetical protein